MNSKSCSLCREIKTIDNFSKAGKRKGKQRITSRCKLCLNNAAKANYNPEKSKIYREKNIEFIKKVQHDRYVRNKDKICANNLKFQKENVEYVRNYHRNYVRKKRKEDPIFKLKDLLRNRTRHAIDGFLKSQTTEDLLGASVEIVKLHIESIFKQGMEWGNHGKWELDHIVPLGSAKNPEEMKLLCHYSNLQPLWKSEHVIKTKTDMKKYSLRSRTYDDNRD